MTGLRTYFCHPEWVRLETSNACISVRGWITENEKAFDANAIAHKLDLFLRSNTAPSLMQVENHIKDWRGNFALCLATDSAVILGVDIVRSIPLLYARHTDGLYISDSCELLIEATGHPDLDAACAEEFLVSGFVYGNATLHSGIQGVQAGELIRLTRNNIESHRYFTFNPDVCQNSDFRPDSQTFQSLDKLLLQAIQRMVNSAKNVRRWVIPLSGGYDSRTIASYLHRLGVTNVLCFSYGRAENTESTISHQVAEALKYEWHFVEYNRTTWARLITDPQTKAYLRYACNGTSLPVLQDFLALSRLRDSGILNESDIIVPGHTLDVITGSHLDANTIKAGIISVSKTSALVQNKHGSFWWDGAGQEEIRKRIQARIEMECEEIRGRSAAAILEWFDWQERQAKFIVNNVRAYEFLGLRWRIPLWDRDLAEWWRAVPYMHRLNRTLFRLAFEQELVVPEVRSITIHGMTKNTSTAKALNNTPLVRSLRLLKDLKVAGQKKRWFRLLIRVFRKYYPPRAYETAMAFEEYFAEEAETIGELLDISAGIHIQWPEALRRHFKWRENLAVRQFGGDKSNWLLAAYVIMHRMSKHV